MIEQIKTVEHHKNNTFLTQLTKLPTPQAKEVLAQMTHLKLPIVPLIKLDKGILMTTSIILREISFRNLMVLNLHQVILAYNGEALKKELSQNHIK